MTVGVVCPRCGHIWMSTSRLSKRKCKKCGRSCGRRSEVELEGEFDV